MTVVIGRSVHDDEQRRRVHAWVSAWYVARGYTVHDGVCRSEVWCKAEAFNGVADDVVIAADADCLPDPQALAWAVERAKVHGWAVPGSKVRRIAPSPTADLLAHDPASDAMPDPRSPLESDPHDVLPGGGIVAVNGRLWDEAGGFDPRFKGWGGEDWALGCALTTLSNSMAQVRPGVIWHLYHPAQPGGRTSSKETDALGWRYRKAKHRPEDMRALIAEWRRDAT